MTMRIGRLAVAAALLGASVSAQAITYNNVLTVGAYQASYQIVTNGNLGTIQASDVLSWSASITGPGGPVSYASTDPGAEFYFQDITATPTQLLISSAVTLSNVWLGYRTVPTVSFVCFAVPGVTCAGDPGSQVALGINANMYNISSTEYAWRPFEGQAVVATAGGVPEPASWALLIAGFGLTGAAMRRRRVAAA